MEVQECDICGEDHETESCPELLQAETSTLGILSRARLTLPHFLQVLDNTDGSTSVTTQQAIGAKTKLGPYEAKRTTQDLSFDSGFILKIIQKDGNSVSLDTRDENQCNWLCLVQTALVDTEQNCMAIQLGSEIYYMTTKEIPPDTELRVWYSPVYAKKLGKSPTPDGITRVLLNQTILQPCPEFVSTELSQALTAEIDGISQEPPSMVEDTSVFSSPNVSILDTPVKIQAMNFEEDSSEGFDDLDAEKVPRLLKKYTCPDCGLVFAADFLLDLHSLMHQPSTQEMVVTKVEDGAIDADTLSDLANATVDVVPTDTESSVQDIDPEKMESLSASQRVIHKPNAVVKKCRHCSEEFADVYELAKHVRHHLVEKSREEKLRAGIKRGRKKGSCLGRGRGRRSLVNPNSPDFDNNDSMSQDDSLEAGSSPVQKRGRPRGRPPLHQSTPGRGSHLLSPKPGATPSPGRGRPRGRPSHSPVTPSSRPAKGDSPTAHTPLLRVSKLLNDARSPGKSTSEENNPDTGVRKSARKVQIRDIVKEAMKVLEDDTNDVEDDITMESDSGEQQVQVKIEPVDDEEVNEIKDSDEKHVEEEPPRKRLRTLSLSPTVQHPGESDDTETIDIQKNESPIKSSFSTPMGPPMTPPRRSGRQRRPSIKLRDVTDSTPRKPPPKQDDGTRVLATVLNIPSQKTVKIKTEPPSTEDVTLDVSKQTLVISTRSQRKAKALEEERMAKVMTRSKEKAATVSDRKGAASVKRTKASDPKDQNTSTSKGKPTIFKEKDKKETVAKKLLISNEKCKDSKILMENDTVNSDATPRKHESGEVEDDQKSSLSEDSGIPVVATLTAAKDSVDSLAGKDETEDSSVLVTIDEDLKKDLLGGVEDEDNGDKENEVALDHVDDDQDPDWLPEAEKEEEETSTKLPKLLQKKVSVKLEKLDRCEVCNGIFKIKDGVISHSCSVKEKFFSCPECGKNFGSEKNLIRHIMTHKKDFSCDDCHKSFARKETLENHTCQKAPIEAGKIAVEGRPGGAWFCEFCGHRYNSEKYLLRHMAAHTGEFKCKECNRMFARKESLMRHILTCCPDMVGKGENQMQVFGCKECGKVFTKETSLMNHMKTHEKNYKCDVCDKSFAVINTLKNHVCGNSDKPYKCPECGKCFSRELYMTRHRAVHLGTFGCSVCGRFYTRKQELVRHSLECNANVQIQAKGSIKCSVCEEAFTDPVKFRIHYEHHTFPFKCTDCGKLFARRSNLNTHKCEPWDQEPVECPICHKMFSNPKYLERHLPIHGEAIYGCDICGKKYRRPDSLNMHVCIDENGEKVMRKKNSIIVPVHSVICPICGKKYVSPSNLNKHMITHGEKNETCPECGKKFHLKIALKEHLKHVHTDQLNYQCKVCGKLMKCRNSLFGHMRQFHGETLIMYACEVCGKHFRQKGNLKKHMFQHEDAKRFSCRFCDRQFKYPEQRRKHELWHQHGQRFSCSICDRKFVMQHELRTHTASVHSGAVYVCKYCSVECRHTHTMKRHLRRRHAYNNEWQSNTKQFIRGLLHQRKADDHGHLHRMVKDEGMGEAAEMAETNGENLTIITSDGQQATVPQSATHEQPLILAEVSGMNEGDDSQAQTVIIQTSGDTQFDPEALVQEVTMTIIGDITQADGQTVPVAFSDSGDGQSIIFVPMMNPEGGQAKTPAEVGNNVVEEVMTPKVEEEGQEIQLSEHHIQYVEQPVDQNGYHIEHADGQQIQYIEHHIEQADGQEADQYEQVQHGEQQVTYVEQVEYVEHPGDQGEYHVEHQVEAGEYQVEQQVEAGEYQLEQQVEQVHIDPQQIVQGEQQLEYVGHMQSVETS